MKPSLRFKYLALLAVFAVLVVTSSCGSGSTTANPNSVTGNWTATLYDTSNNAIYTFTTTLNQQVASPATSSPVTGSNFKLTTNTSGSCFNAASDAAQTGTYTVSGNLHGLTTTTVDLTITGNPGTLSMLGSFSTNNISGPWALQTTGSGCVLNGTFLMTRS